MDTYPGTLDTYPSHPDTYPGTLDTYPSHPDTHTRRVESTKKEKTQGYVKIKRTTLSIMEKIEKE
ncbi:MAG: hypothetical protein LBP19_01525 [Treponema sp.]|nr:hypothetical protein [Treponema sp.]